MSKSSFSYLKIYLSHFISPNLPGKRHREFTELMSKEQEYIQENETPNEEIRAFLVETLGEDFQAIAHSLSEDGVLILPGYFAGARLNAVQEAFAREIAKKKAHPFLKQIAFNASVDANVDPQTLDTVLEAGSDENLLDLPRLSRHSSLR